ncbi:MAG: SdpI family protein [Hungatella sp.]|jgi:hypothetical protein|nr:SdpI family protein [Hungatella sp.]
MWFWWFMFFSDLLIPALMAGSGRMMYRHPPKSINGLVGYRTARSMKNPDTWKFAQDYCGRLWWKIGWRMAVPSVLIHLPLYGRSEDLVGVVGGILCMVQYAVLIGCIFPTERALKRNFTEDGERKV